MNLIYPIYKLYILSQLLNILRIMWYEIVECWKLGFFLFPGYLEFGTESYKNKTSLQNENESFLILYRKIITPVGTLISCAFAFIIVRELRLYYVASKATATSEPTEKKYTNGVYIV